MAGEQQQSIANSALDVRTKIGEFAAKLRDIHVELGGRIDNLVSNASGLWIGPTPPTDLLAYSGWVNTSSETIDLLYNAGTLQSPNWVSILSESKRPATFGVPYKTPESINGRDVWAVDLSLGYLPNNTLKLVPIPPAVLSSWGPVSERWIDQSSTFAFSEAMSRVIPLPYTVLMKGSADVPVWDKFVQYTTGSYVQLNNVAYEANQTTTNDDPSKNSGVGGVWTDLGPIDSAPVPRLNNVSDVTEIYLDNDMMAVRTASNRTDYQGRVTIKYLLAP